MTNLKSVEDVYAKYGVLTSEQKKVQENEQAALLEKNEKAEKEHLFQVFKKNQKKIEVILPQEITDILSVTGAELRGSQIWGMATPESDFDIVSGNGHNIKKIEEFLTSLGGKKFQDNLVFRERQGRYDATSGFKGSVRVRYQENVYHLVVVEHILTLDDELRLRYDLLNKVK